VNSGFVVDGAGKPVTICAAGGLGAGNFDWMRSWSADFAGTRVCFRYGEVEPWSPSGPPRRAAERDSAEVLAVADYSDATRAVGVSRGTFAIAGVLADDPGRFDRVVFVIPPAGTAAGRYREWLLELPADEHGPVTGADILILAMRGDSGHPVKVAEEWAGRLGAQLEVFPSSHFMPDVLGVMRERCREFLD
jgi:hypothetical protein